MQWSLIVRVGIPSFHSRALMLGLWSQLAFAFDFALVLVVLSG